MPRLDPEGSYGRVGDPPSSHAIASRRPRGGTWPVCTRAPRGGHLRCSADHGSAAHPQLLDHRPHRPRQVDAGRSHPRAHPHRRDEGHAGPAAGLDGPRARAGDHDQGPGGARVLHRQGRADLPAASDRHARARGLHLRGLPLAGGVRGGAAGRGRLPGGGGPDGRQHLPGGGVGAGADPLPEQDRPARGRARAGGRRSERADRRAAGVDPADQRQDRRGSGAGARGAGRTGAAAGGRRRGAGTGADLRLGVRPVPRRGGLHPGRATGSSARASRSARWPPAPRRTSTRSASSAPR